MKRKNGNNSSLGTASHIEKHFPSTQNTNSLRRSRHKCLQYEKETKRCQYLGIACVGPSNALCTKYTEETAKPPHSIHVGALVNDSRYGVGMVIRLFGSGFCEVRYHKGDILKTYNAKEIKQILLSETASK